MRRFLFLLVAGVCMGGTSALASPGPVSGASKGVSTPSIRMLDLMAGRASTRGNAAAQNCRGRCGE